MYVCLCVLCTQRIWRIIFAFSAYNEIKLQGSLSPKQFNYIFEQEKKTATNPFHISGYLIPCSLSQRQQQQQQTQNEISTSTLFTWA